MYHTPNLRIRTSPIWLVWKKMLIPKMLRTFIISCYFWCLSTEKTQFILLTKTATEHFIKYLLILEITALFSCIWITIDCCVGFSSGSGVRIHLQCRRCERGGLDLWVGKIPWRRKWQPTAVFLLGGSHGRRSLAGYSLWGHRVRHNWALHTHVGSAHSGCLKLHHWTHPGALGGQAFLISGIDGNHHTVYVTGVFFEG